MYRSLYRWYLSMSAVSHSSMHYLRTRKCYAAPFINATKPSSLSVQRAGWHLCKAEDRKTFGKSINES